MEENKYSRREFISKKLFTGSLLLGGTLAFGLNAVKALAKDRSQLEGDQQPHQTGLKSKKKAVHQKAGAPKKADAAAKEAPSPCDDMTGVSPADLEKRKKLAYVNKAPIPDKHCGNCGLYLKPPPGATCGKCTLFKGPVRAEGACTYWAPIANVE
ncbi:high-potential iron-sulfur protein [Mucilaginibacter boryungensis]|uniref:High-potential iron-sulfur protein n=1 Tax=Mucilaginibacter boryungensis TaxID=768480 RepID=A0ABR9XDL0_9SPHI|nr:high-potential iron-sulfur protein [Mucilaginibacter boryungensis]MBE9665481.1 high-potential iron-sulfur protein [Mucilaginibacter boryungensis]